MVKAWVMEWLWRLDLQMHVVRQVEELLNADEAASLPEADLQILHGQLLLMRAQEAYFNNQTTQAIDLCRRVLTLVPPTWKYVHTGAMLYLSFSLQSSGQALEAERFLLTEYDSCPEKMDAYAARVIFPLCFNYFNSGQLAQTRKIAELVHQTADRIGLAVLKSWGNYYSGVVLYQWNELEMAEKHLLRVVENPYTAQIISYRNAAACLALIHQSQGRSTEAWQLVESISHETIRQTLKKTG